jgi:broad specificity phosphatase PhoE
MSAPLPFTTTILYIRHAETPNNATKMRRGEKTNEPLSDIGMLQAATLAYHFARKYPDTSMMYTSPKLRAIQTATEISTTLFGKVDLKEDKRLIEVVSGLQEDTPYEEADRISEDYNRLIVDTYSDPNDRPQFAGGESNNKAIERMEAFALEIAETHPGEKIATVTHAHALDLFLKNLFPEAPRLKNCDVIELFCDPSSEDNAFTLGEHRKFSDWKV